MIMKVIIALVVLFFCGESYVYADTNPPTEPLLKIENKVFLCSSDASGQWLGLGSNVDGQIWDVKAGRLVQRLHQPQGADVGSISCPYISPDGRWVAMLAQNSWNILDEGSSIYLFERSTGKLIRRVYSEKKLIDISWSPDGKWIAASTLRGFFIYKSDPLNKIYSNLDDFYFERVSGVTFSRAGVLGVTSRSGLFKLYEISISGVSAIAKGKGSIEILSGKFSPDGEKFAITGASGDKNSNALEVFSTQGKILQKLFSRKIPSANGEQRAGDVTWSVDGKFLYAATPIALGKVIWRWDMTGSDVSTELVASDGDIGFQSLLALPDGSLAFSSDEGWGLLGSNGNRILNKLNPSILNDDELRVSSNGKKIAVAGHGFDIDSRLLIEKGEKSANDLDLPVTRSESIKISDWRYPGRIKLNGNDLDPYQKTNSLSLAIAPDNSRFVVGYYDGIKAFDPQGRNIWSVVSNSARWVNITNDGRLLVAMTDSGVVSWYRMSDGVKLLQLFVHRDLKRWIMWTPEGYYDASPGGEELIGWHLNQGKDKEARFIPSSQLYDVFFRPDIVQAKFRGDDISSLITITATEALKNPPPILSFTKVPSTSTSNKEKICYKATSTDGGIGEVRLFQNGKLVRSDGFYRETLAKKSDEKMQLAFLDSTAIQQALRGLKVTQSAVSPIASNDKGKEFEECQELETLSGENEISVAAFNATNTIQSALETVHFNVERQPEESHLYVLGVGINKYNDTSATLKYAVKDANDFQVMMRKKSASLYKPQNIHIEGLSDNEANKDSIQKAIQSLSNKIKPWDSFIFFVASHGFMMENQYYIVTAGFNGSTNPDNLISSNEIVGMSKSIKALSQLFIFDTCHAGGIDNIVSGLYDARMSVMAKKMGLHIYASAGNSQAALDGYKGNGLFTHTLLKSMREGMVSDINHDNQVSIAELGEQARQETIEISRKLKHPQTPNIINFGKDNVLFKTQ